MREQALYSTHSCTQISHFTPELAHLRLEPERLSQDSFCWLDRETVVFPADVGFESCRPRAKNRSRTALRTGESDSLDTRLQLLRGTEAAAVRFRHVGVVQNQQRQQRFRKLSGGSEEAVCSAPRPARKRPALNLEYAIDKSIHLISRRPTLLRDENVERGNSDRLIDTTRHEPTGEDAGALVRLHGLYAPVREELGEGCEVVLRQSDNVPPVGSPEAGGVDATGAV